MRLDRQAAAGLSAVTKPQRRLSSRIWALVSPEARYRVVGVGSGGDGRDAEPAGEGCENVQQLGFAEIAAVAGVGGVPVPLHLRGRDRFVPYAEVGGEAGRAIELSGGQGVGNGGGGDDELGAARASGCRQQERRVRAAGERHDQRPDVAQALDQVAEAAVEQLVPGRVVHIDERTVPAPARRLTTLDRMSAGSE
jgi:hypothetical protein